MLYDRFRWLILYSKTVRKSFSCLSMARLLRRASSKIISRMGNARRLSNLYNRRLLIPPANPVHSLVDSTSIARSVQSCMSCWTPLFIIFDQQFNIFEEGPTIPEPFPPGEPDPGLPINFYGSCMGITPMSPGQKFSVGMDCPNTIFGGTNSIRLTSGTAKTAADLAASSGNATESITVGSVRLTASCAAKLGSINYGIYFIE